MPGRLLLDASTLITLSEIGELAILRSTFGEVYTTEAVFTEATVEGYPGSEVLKEACGAGWLRIVDAAGDTSRFEPYGLERGEATLFLAAEPEDVLVLDELPARSLASALGLAFTGLLGLLVLAVEAGNVSPSRGRKVLDGIERSDFRATGELYAWARDRIDQAGHG